MRAKWSKWSKWSPIYIYMLPDILSSNAPGGGGSPMTSSGGGGRSSGGGGGGGGMSSSNVAAGGGSGSMLASWEEIARQRWDERGGNATRRKGWMYGGAEEGARERERERESNSNVVGGVSVAGSHRIASQPLLQRWCGLERRRAAALTQLPVSSVEDTVLASVMLVPRAPPWVG